MARPKGSKNKARTVKASVDYAAVVAEKTAEKEKIESEVATLTANLDDLKTQMKAKKAELKAVTKELTKAENKKAAAEAKAMEEAKKGEAEDVLKKLLASGAVSTPPVRCGGIIGRIYQGGEIGSLTSCLNIGTVTYKGSGSSPKCILIATNFPSISISLIPAATQSFLNLSN